MSLPNGVAKDYASGAVFIKRTPEELQSWTADELRLRWQWVNSRLNASGLAFDRAYVRHVALLERSALAREINRRRI